MVHSIFKINPIEGDFIRDIHGIYYDVKGFEHPPDRIIAYPRYIPDKSGDRLKDGIRYRKIYDLKDRYRYISKVLKEYLVFDNVFGRLVPEIPLKHIVEYVKPVRRLALFRKCYSSLIEPLRSAVDLAKLIVSESKILWDSIGLTGSLSIGLFNESSDIDLIIYGSSNTLRVLKALSRLFSEGILSRYDENQLHRLYRFRKAYYNLSFNEFKTLESRKIDEGLYKGRDFYIRFVKSSNELHKYGEYRYRYVCRALIRGLVIDDSEAPFTPCRYIVRLEVLKCADDSIKAGIDMLELTSFRGRYSNLLVRNDYIEALGRLEAVYRNDDLTGYRLVVGEDYMDYVKIID